MQKGKLLAIVGVSVPVLLAMGGAFVQYGKDKGVLFRSIEALNSRVSADEIRYASDIERLRIESYKRWEEIKKGMAPIEALRREQAVTSQRLEVIEEQQKALRQDMKEYQRDTRKALDRILEKLTERRSL